MIKKLHNSLYYPIVNSLLTRNTIVYI